MPIKTLPKIKVVGVGGSGVNAVSRMHKEKISGVELIAVNTDAQVLKVCPVSNKILIGKKTTGGFGAGMDVHLGEKAAKESAEELKKSLEGAELVFLTCGLGGGTGSGAIAAIGEIAKQVGALTVAIVTLPFVFEGAQRKAVANWGLKRLEGKVDSFLVIQNDRLLKLVGPNATIENGFWVADSILREAVKGISDLVSLPGIINVDFADLRSILLNSGRAFLGIGRAKGEKRALSAASSALQSPLLDFSLKDAQGILLNIAGNDDLSITEVNMAATFIKKNALPTAKIIFGVSEDSHIENGEIKITVIATSKI